MSSVTCHDILICMCINEFLRSCSLMCFCKLTSIILTGMLLLLVFILASNMAPVPDTVKLTK